MTRILVDYHHSDLFESHQLLFEDRLGIEVWRPIGMEWFTEGYWNFERANHGDAVAKQYLSIWDSDTDEGGDGLFMYRRDSTHPWRHHRMVTLEMAKQMRWDAVMSSVPDNEEGLHRFAQEVGAKFGVHIGNEAQYSDWKLADFALISSLLPYKPSVPHVVYHQPFDLELFRHEWPPAEEKSVSSFIQCFAENETPYAEFLAHARRIPDMDWKVYGAYGGHDEDEFACGNLSPVAEVGRRMRDSRVIWHSKSWSDGFG